MTKEEAKQKIAELCKKYESLSQSEIKGYNEAATKLGFIEPMFRALGWNVEDKNEVAPEDKVSSGRVDYAFKLHGVSQFYLEAKPLRADLTKPEYAKQAVTYAYNKGVRWAILSDFERLIVFIAQTGKPFITRTFDRYLTDFDDLWLLSKESFQDNALAEKAEKYGVLPLHIPIETRLFTRLRQWREELFNQLRAHNENLSFAKVDEVIQKLFDRLIFIRTCEDRNLEEKRLLAAANQWKSAGHKGELIEELRQIFILYRDTYDSELFDEHLTDEVFIEGSTIENILSGLYEIPGSLASYDFNDIGVDVLGTVYEQYLGYVAAKVKERVEAQLKLGITDEETYKIISKKQRRKEQGIYYTPQFVTDYIVRETVGRFIKEHNYNEIRTMKILDPACGSGSFLIRAYDELLNYHAKERNRPLNELDQKDRLPVLLNNIYGVDLDMQAVEITRLNLLLRTLTKKGKLPYLSNNIRRGNSLISGSKEELKKYFGDKWRERNPFNWEKEFKDIMTQDGFDVVIGNPPYVRVDTLATDEKSFWKTKFVSAVGKYDLYYLFLELAFKLLKPNGIFAFIVPNRFCTNTTGENLRKLIFSEGARTTITSVSRLRVFEEAANYPVIIVVQKGTASVIPKLTYLDVSSPEELQKVSPAYKLSQDELNVLPRAIIPININERRLKVALKLLKANDPVGKIVKIQEGLRIPTKLEVKGPKANKQLPIIKQYQFSRYSPIKEASFITEKSFKGLMSGNADRVLNCGKEKLVFAEDALRIESTIDKSKGLCQGGVYFATLRENATSLPYLLALFNSRLLTFVFKSLYSAIHMGGGYLRFRTQYLQELPICRIDFNNSAEKKMHNALVALVDRMLGLNERLAPIRDTYCNERDELLQQIEQTDKEIDNIVYDLYGLTDEERKIVETVRD